MGFFRRFAQGLGHSTPVAGIAQAGSSWGWVAVDEPFDGGTADLIEGAVRTLHGAFRTMRPNDGLPTRQMDYHDAYRGTRDGRAVTVANSWFLQQLSDGDRQRLAASPTPLATFADVRSPDEAVARLMALPDVERLQLLAMFQKADSG